MAAGPLTDRVILRGADVLGRFGRPFPFLDAGRGGGRFEVVEGGLATLEGPAAPCGATA